MPEHNLNIDLNALIDEVYGKGINPFHLPKNLYNETAKVLKAGVSKGYKGTVGSFAFGTPDYIMLNELTTNIYMFSAAKTFQQTLEMSDALVKAGKYVSFKDFKTAAEEIYTKYNGGSLAGEVKPGWLAAEYDTAIESARSAAKWVDVEKNIGYFPYLKYSAVMDEHTCTICRPLNGIILPVKDKFWSKSMPPNHFRCECVVEQLDGQDAQKEGVSNKTKVDNAQEDSQEKKNPLFNFNPGKDKVIFKDTGKNKHPYFEVPKQYKELAKHNFNLGIPEHD